MFKVLSGISMSKLAWALQPCMSPVSMLTILGWCEMLHSDMYHECITM